MDSGLNTERVYTIEERINGGIFPDDSKLKSSEIVAVMDHLFVNQVD